MKKKGKKIKKRGQKRRESKDKNVEKVSTKNEKE